MEQQNDISKLLLEESRSRLKEIHSKLDEQSKFYRFKATLTLYLIIFVSIVGLFIFAFPNFLIRNNSKKYDYLINESLKYQLLNDSLIIKH